MQLVLMVAADTFWQCDLPRDDKPLFCRSVKLQLTQWLSGGTLFRPKMVLNFI